MKRRRSFNNQSRALATWHPKILDFSLNSFVELQIEKGCLEENLVVL